MPADWASLAQPPAAAPVFDVQMQVVGMRGIGAGAKHGGEMQAGRAAQGALERLGHVATVAARGDLDARAILEPQGGDVEGIAKGVL